jgi:ubiquinol-cytochrome c reductase cytochrome c subunit
MAAAVAAAVLLFPGPPPAGAQDGGSIYEQNCQSCHGAQGEGGVGPSLQDQDSVEAVAQQVRVGGGGMPAFEGVLTDQQISEVATFVVEQIAGEEPPAPTTAPSPTGAPSPTASPSPPGELSGRQIYQQNCAQCHGVNGEGGIGPNIQDITDVARAEQAVRTGPGAMPSFEGVLTDEQISAVARFVAEELGEAPGEGVTARTGPEIYAQACAGCHGDEGQGIEGAGPSLAAAAFPDIVAEKVRVGGGGMPAFERTLDGDQIMAVSTYVAEELSDPAARQATVQAGGVAYRLYCAGCHGAQGRGGAMTAGPNAPSFVGVPAANSLSAMLIGPGNMPTFVGTVDARQQAGISLYVDFLVDPPEPGGFHLGYNGPVGEGFVSWLGLGLLLLFAVWLAWGKGGAPGD